MNRKSLLVVAAASVLLGGTFTLVAIPHLSDLLPESRAARARYELNAGATDIQQALELVAEAVSPSVVAITSQKVVPVVDYDPFFGPNQRRPRDGAEQELRPNGLGSGVLVSAEGHILTNNHVIADSDELKVHLADGRALRATLLGRDPATDIAVIKVTAEGLIPAPLGDSDAIKVGHFVAAFGSPFGLVSSMTSGIISAKGRAHLGITEYEDFLQTDAAISRGNSGGPLVNLKGEVIGINTAILSQSGFSSGIGFAVPINLAKSVMQHLLEDGRVARGHLGVVLQEITADDTEKAGVAPGKGLIISSVAEGTAAHLAGLEHGDILLTLNNYPITGSASFRSKIAALRPGTPIRLELLRNGTPQTLTLPVGEAPTRPTRRPLGR